MFADWLRVPGQEQRRESGPGLFTPKTLCPLHSPTFSPPRPSPRERCEREDPEKGLRRGLSSEKGLEFHGGHWGAVENGGGRGPAWESEQEGALACPFCPPCRSSPWMPPVLPRALLTHPKGRAQGPRARGRFWMQGTRWE